MCTAATYQTKNHYFGRNLDYDFSYGEEAVIIPRNFPFHFREAGSLNSHYAIIGIAYIASDPASGADYPLLYDAINEKGLGIAGLNFVGNAVYHDHIDGKDNIAQFEFLPWLLSQCATVEEAKVRLANLNFRGLDFNPQLPPAELHWIISDTTGACIVVESTKSGLHIYDNPIGILTNNPPFDEQLFQLNNYQHLSAKNPQNNFAPNYHFDIYSRGMGAIGLPGDLSSSSRFVKAAFTKLNSLSADDELSSVSQFFHILHSVDQQYGCCDVAANAIPSTNANTNTNTATPETSSPTNTTQRYEYTIYTSCYNLDEGIFYYTTYNNHQISALRLSSADLSSNALFRFPVIETEQINYQN